MNGTAFLDPFRSDSVFDRIPVANVSFGEDDLATTAASPSQHREKQHEMEGNAVLRQERDFLTVTGITNVLGLHHEIHSRGRF